MTKRRNLSDDIHGDRADVRKHRDMFGREIANDMSGKDWRKGDIIDFDRGKDYFQGGHSYGGGYTASCYKGHPALPIPGTNFVIYGGSCSTPAVTDADVYIGFESGMRWTQRHWPWKKGTEIQFLIRDFNAPDNPEEFKKLVTWTKKQIEAGMKVHAGCFGGHGRTGMFLAAVVAEFGEKDAINYVRKHYCHKAVESNKQVQFLHEQFGITKAQGAKEGLYRSGAGHSTSSKTSKPKGGKKGKKGKGLETQVITPISGNGSIW